MSTTQHRPRRGLLHGREEQVFADAGYIGAEKRAALKDRTLTWHIAAKRSQVKALPEGQLKDLSWEYERRKAQIRSRVEHPFHVAKNLFGHKKGALQGTHEEPRAVAGALRPGQSLPAAQAVAGPVTGEVRLRSGRRAAMK